MSGFDRLRHVRGWPPVLGKSTVPSPGARSLLASKEQPASAEARKKTAHLGTPNEWCRPADCFGGEQAHDFCTVVMGTVQRVVVSLSAGLEVRRYGREPGSRTGLSRWRLDNLHSGIVIRKSRPCLDFVAIGQEEPLHLEEVGASQAPSEPSLQVERKADDDFFTVASPRRAPLFLLHDASAAPASGGHVHELGVQVADAIR
jgi:hypothetical protein